METLGLLVIGHGSRRAEANAVLSSVAATLGSTGRYAAVRAAFLELASPTIPDAYGELVAVGCDRVLVHPFFLFPGVHTMADIPEQLRLADAAHPGASWTLTEPLGLHPSVLEAAQARIDAALTPAAT